MLSRVSQECCATRTLAAAILVPDFCEEELNLVREVVEACDGSGCGEKYIMRLLEMYSAAMLAASSMVVEFQVQSLSTWRRFGET